MRLGDYSPQSRSYVQGVLRSLFEQEYLDRPRLPHFNTGRTSYVYCLRRKALRYLDSRGFDVTFRYRRVDQAHPSYPYMSHEMDLNDLLICASLLCRGVSQFQLEETIHEWYLRRRYRARVSITVTNGMKLVRKDVGVIPDAILRFRRSDGVYMPILLELDRCTASLWKIKQKLHALIAYVLGPYPKLFGMPFVTIAFAVPNDNTTRRDLLLGYIEQVLEESGQKSESMIDLFRVCCLPVGVLDPQQVFLSPLWYRPFDFEQVGISETKTRKVYTKPMPILEVT